ncbi:hypothetical protein V6N13_013137 [Hibiscus sabdariffa]|uniref:Uncharacterized protein n=1 Tax=Hibiscus sabdariffa TaxID=183260 RepID=A0ABR2SHT3_9ROSI
MKAKFFILCILLASTLAFPASTVARQFPVEEAIRYSAECALHPTRTCTPKRPPNCSIYNPHCNNPMP